MITIIGLEDGTVLGSLEGILPISKGDYVMDNEGIARTVLYKKFNMEHEALCLIVR